MEKKSQISKKNGDSGAKNDVFSLMLLVCFRSTHETGLAAEPNLATRGKFLSSIQWRSQKNGKKCATWVKTRITMKNHAFPLILLVFPTFTPEAGPGAEPNFAPRDNFLSSIQWRAQKERKRCASGFSRGFPGDF
jgi:hypothetical protein